MLMRWCIRQQALRDKMGSLVYEVEWGRWDVQMSTRTESAFDFIDDESPRRRDQLCIYPHLCIKL